MDFVAMWMGAGAAVDDSALLLQSIGGFLDCAMPSFGIRTRIQRRFFLVILRLKSFKNIGESSDHAADRLPIAFSDKKRQLESK
jgi:hypothetical protein